MEKMFKLMTRYIVKPMLSPSLPLSLQRFTAAAGSLILKSAPNCKYSKTSLGSRPALKIVPQDTHHSRTVIYLHGGGYVIGGFASHSKLASWIAHTLNAHLWLPNYGLSPEHVFPFARDSALACYRELLDSGVSGKDIILAGDSAGGGLALSTCIAIRDAGLPLPSSLILLSPLVDLSLSGTTIESHAKRDDMLSLGFLKFGASAYAGEQTLRDPGCSPLFADLSGLPPMLIQVGTEEMLLDDSRRLAEKTVREKVDSKLEVHENAGHVFQFMAGQSANADRAIKSIATFCNKHNER